MRRIGNLSPESTARRFCDYLLTQGIEGVVDAGQGQPPEAFEIWIRHEDDVGRARAALEHFQRAPDAPEFHAASARASELRHGKVDERWQRHVHSSRAEPVSESRSPAPGRRSPPRPAGPASEADEGPSEAQRESGEPEPAIPALLQSEVRQQSFPVTIGLIALSIIASFSTNFATPRGSRLPGKVTIEAQLFDELSFVDRREYQRDQDPFASVARGEIWRFLTPMFLHGNMFHLFFNMFWIYVLGSLIERIHGSVFFLILVSVTQITGMLVQVMLPAADWMPEALHGSPFAIGASGAAYGLFGFLWIRPWLDRDYPIELDSTQINLMLLALVVCLTPLVPNVANGAHLGGLTAGMMAALLGRGFELRSGSRSATGP